jgi:hypothetical protein
MLVESPLHSQQRLPQTSTGNVVFVGVAGNGQLIFQLDAIPQAVVEVEVGRLIVGISWIVVGDEADVDLPMAIARRVGIVGEKWRSSLRMNRLPGDKQLQPKQKQEQARPWRASGRGSEALSRL